MRPLAPDIFSAAQRGQSELLRSLLKPEAEVPVDLLNGAGVTPLMLAAEAGQLEAVSILLEHGAQSALQDAESGYTALHRACLRGQLHIVATLLRSGGANLDAPLDREGLSPLELLQLVHGPPTDPDQLLASGDVYTWGQAGCLPLGRSAGSCSHESRPARAKLPAAPSSLEDHACEAAARRGETVDARGVTRIAAAKHHTLFADAAGALFSCGLGVGGRLGNGSEAALPLPCRVRLAPGRRVVALAAALHHSFAITSCGELWAWGASGAPLGLEPPSSGEMGAVLSPRRVAVGAKEASKERVILVDVATSDSHALAADRTGCVWSWGGNARGQCGHPVAVAAERRPRRIDALAGSVIINVAAGDMHSAAVGRDGKLWCWGHDVPAPQRVKLPLEEAPHGMRSHHRRSKPLALQVVCGASHTAACANTGAVYVWNGELRPRLVRLGDHQVVSLAASRYSIYAVTSGGLLYSWNEHWHANHTPRPHWHSELRCVTQVAAAEQHCAALVAVRRPPKLPVGAASHSIDVLSEDEAEHTGLHSLSDHRGANTEALAAEKSVPSLQCLCERQVAAIFTPRNILDLLYTADALMAVDLAAAARAFVRHNMPLLLRKPRWTHLPTRILVELAQDLGGGVKDNAFDDDEVATAEDAWTGGRISSPLAGAPAEPRQRARQLRKKLKQVDILERRPFGCLTPEQRAKVLSRTRLEYELNEIMSSHPELLLELSTPILSPAIGSVTSPVGANTSADDARDAAQVHETSSSSSSSHHALGDGMSTSAAGISLLSRAAAEQRRGGRRETACQGASSSRASRGSRAATAADGPLLRQLEGATLAETPPGSAPPPEDSVQVAMRSSISGWTYQPIGTTRHGTHSAETADEMPPGGGTSGAAAATGSCGRSATQCASSSAPSLVKLMAEEEASAQLRATRQPQIGPAKPPASSLISTKGSRSPATPAHEPSSPHPAPSFPILQFVKRTTPSTTPSKPSSASPSPSPSCAWASAPSVTTSNAPSSIVTSERPASPPSLSSILAEEKAMKKAMIAPASTPMVIRSSSGGSGSRGKGKPKFVPLSALEAREASVARKAAWGGAGNSPSYGSASNPAVALEASSHQCSPPAKPLAEIFREEQAASLSRRHDETALTQTRWGLLPELRPVSLADIQQEEADRTAADVEAAEVAAAIAAVEAAEKAAVVAQRTGCSGGGQGSSTGNRRKGGSAGTGAVHTKQARAKAVACRHFAAGTCSRGASCPFLHDDAEGPNAKPVGATKAVVSVKAGKKGIRSTGGVQSHTTNSASAKDQVTITLTRTTGERWGVRLRGGPSEPPAVEAVLDGGLAEGRLHVGDVLLSICGKAQLGHEAATSTLKEVVGEVELAVLRLGAMCASHAGSSPRSTSAPHVGKAKEPRQPMGRAISLSGAPAVVAAACT